VAQEELENLKHELLEIEEEMAKLRAERRLFGRSSFSPEWLILRQRALQTERERCQNRIRELERMGVRAAAAGSRRLVRRRSVLRGVFYTLSALVVILIVVALYRVMGQMPANAPAAAITPTATAMPTVVPSPTPKPTETPVVYKVVPGDTLSKIARRYGIADWKVIARANNIQDPRALRVGQELIIPPTPTPTPTPLPSPTPTPTPAR
jgi:LysM repeat protein